MQFFDLFPDLPPVAEEDRDGYSLLDHDLGGAEDLLVLPLRKDNPFRVGLCHVDDMAHGLLGLPLERFQAFHIFFHILDRLACHARIHGRPGDRRGNPQERAGIERLGNDIITPERELDIAIGAADRFRALFPRQLRKGVGRGNFHLLVDGGGAHIEGAAEDKGETENVIDLVRIVGTSGGDDGVVPHLFYLFRGDLRVRIGHGEDDRVFCQLPDHLSGKGPPGGKAEEDIGPDHGLVQGAARGIGGKPLLVRVHPRARVPCK